MAAQSVATVALVPPPRLPDLFPVLVSATAYLHFLGTFVYFNIVQFSTPPGKKSQKKMNWPVPRSVIHPRCFAIFVSRRSTGETRFCSVCAWKLDAILFHSENNWNADRKTLQTVDRWRLIDEECWNVETFWFWKRRVSNRPKTSSSPLTVRKDRSLPLQPPVLKRQYHFHEI